MRSLLILALLAAATVVLAQSEPPITRFIPTVAEVGQGCTSNRVAVLVDPLSAPSESADPNESAGWLEHARQGVETTSREAHAVLRYFFGKVNCMVYVNRWETDDALREAWNRVASTKPPAGGLPRVGEYVRFSQRDGMHNNIAFRRGRYTIEVEAPLAAGLDPVKRLVQVLDQTLVTASARPGK